MLSSDLEMALHRTFISACQARHEYIAPEHLLLRILDDPLVLDHLKRNSVDVASLKLALEEVIARVPVLTGEVTDAPCQPNAEFQRAIRAAIHNVKVQKRKLATALDVLAAFLDPHLNLAITQLLTKLVSTSSLELLGKAAARFCTFCGALTTSESWMLVENRGVLCPACATAVTFAVENRKKGV